MMDLEGIAKFLTAIAVIIGAVTGLITAVKHFWKQIKPFWDKIMKPALKFVAISLTLIIPNGIIVWYFVFRIAEDWTPIIRNRDIFLSVVAWLTVFVSAYSLLWGMWLYPVIVRLFIQYIQSLNESDLNQPISDQGGGTS